MSEQVDSQPNSSGSTGDPSSNGLKPSANGREPVTGGSQSDTLKRATIGEVERRYAQIIGWGRYIPEKVITNRDLEQIVDTSDEWIRTRTGIEERHVVVDPKETSATMGVEAARHALEVADLWPSRVDLVICCTSSPEHLMPATACLIQDALGAVNAGAYDLNAACSGFVYGLAMARGHILAGDAEYVLVVGVETYSRFINWTDRNTCVLFGDGAGAMIVAASDMPGGILATELGSDGSGGNALKIPAGGSAMPATLETVNSGSHFMTMDGKAVFRFAARTIASATRKVIERAGLALDDIDMIIPHQANMRILRAGLQKQLKIPDEKIFVNLQKYGNTGSATIPIALCEAIEEGRISTGDNVVFVGFGGGLTWSACTVKWSVPVERTEFGWWKNTRRRATYQAAAARSMWRRAVRWMYDALPTDPLGRPIKEQPTIGTEKDDTEQNNLE